MHTLCVYQVSGVTINAIMLILRRSNGDVSPTRLNRMKSRMLEMVCIFVKQFCFLYKPQQIPGFSFTGSPDSHKSKKRHKDKRDFPKTLEGFGIAFNDGECDMRQRGCCNSCHNYGELFLVKTSIMGCLFK